MNTPDNLTLQAMVQKSESDSGAPDAKSPSLLDRFSWPGRIAILLAIVLSPWAFGSVQHWAQQWMMALLLVGTAFWWFETALNKGKSQVFPTIFFLVAAGLTLGLVQTVPLPDAVAETVLGRQSEIYSEFSVDSNSKPSISLNREGTWHQIRLLMIALTGLALGCRYFRTRRDLVLLMTVVAANGVLISFFGIIQKLTSNGKMFWIHEVALGGEPFGPFVNRNNGAGYLMMCLACCIGLIPIVMSNQKRDGAHSFIGNETSYWRYCYYHLLAFISELTATKLMLILGIALIASGVVSSLSRGAVVAMFGAGIGTLLVYGMARRPKNIGFVLLPFLLLALALSGWIGFWDELGARFGQIDVVNVADADTRVQHWKETWPAVEEMGWFGAGLGSYRGVHRLYRQGNEGTLFHYAENQYFQSLVEAGVVGLVLFLGAWFLAYQYSSLAIYRGQSATSIGVGTMGLYLVLSQSIASMFDFGLYIPANLLLMSVLVGFLAYHSQSLAGRLTRRSWLRFELSNHFVQLVVLVLFAGGVMVTLDLHRRANLDRLMVPRTAEFEQRPLDSTEVDNRLAELTPLIQRTPTVASLNYAGELWLYRSRLAFLETIQNRAEFESTTMHMDEEQKASYIDNLWVLTDLQRIQGNLGFLKREGTMSEFDEFLDRLQIRDNFPQAASCFAYSTQRSPLQPWVHLRLGEVKGIIGKRNEGDIDIERALRLAPGNADFQKAAGIYYLQSGNTELAALHFRKFLELKPQRFAGLIRSLKLRNYRTRETLSDALVIEKIIPDDPQMLYLFAVTYLDESAPEFEECLEKAAQLVGKLENKQRDDLILLGNIRTAEGDLAAAIKHFKTVLTNRPDSPQIRYKRARLLFELGELDEALAEAIYLKRHTKGRSAYNEFFDEVESRIEQRDRQ